MKALFAVVGVALATGAGASAPMQPLQHRETAGDVTVDYTGTVRLTYDQVGSPASGGRQASLRCRWSADLVAMRVRVPGDTTPEPRPVIAPGVVSGSEEGWCRSAPARVARALARQRGALAGKLAELARLDQRGALAID